MNENSWTVHESLDNTVKATNLQKVCLVTECSERQLAAFYNVCKYHFDPVWSKRCNKCNLLHPTLVLKFEIVVLFDHTTVEKVETPKFRLHHIHVEYYRTFFNETVL